MQIFDLEYSYARSATTNPPVYEVKDITLQNDAGEAVMHYAMHGTWGEKELDIALTPAQMETLCTYFADGQIRAQAEKPVPPIYAMPVGGSTSESFSFCDESGRVETSLMSAQMRGVLQFLESLVPRDGAPPAGAAQAPTGAFVNPEPIAAAQAGQWVCAFCGTVNSGNFCTECGKQRS
ncbi:MAG: hypothetical protein E7517_07590 [Ruminococcaceae bacterium]|nr:hypothetical protein [Oscillospiraceae bacterium]